MWAAARGAAAGFLVGHPGTLGGAAAFSLCASLTTQGTRFEISPSPGRAGPGGMGGGGAVESQASGSLSSGLPPRPGVTRGTPGLRRAVTLFVWTGVHPRGRFPGRHGAGARRMTAGRGRGPERLPGVVSPPSGDLAQPLPGAPAPAPHGAQPSARGAAGPSGPPHPAAAPPPCQGRSKLETRKI
ncbi:uncharacterized protein LOC103792657 [Callithrix jacchus]